MDTSPDLPDGQDRAACDSAHRWRMLAAIAYVGPAGGVGGTKRQRCAGDLHERALCLRHRSSRGLTRSTPWTESWSSAPESSPRASRSMTSRRKRRRRPDAAPTAATPPPWAGNRQTFANLSAAEHDGSRSPRCTKVGATLSGSRDRSRKTFSQPSPLSIDAPRHAFLATRAPKPRLSKSGPRTMRAFGEPAVGQLHNAHQEEHCGTNAALNSPD